MESGGQLGHSYSISILQNPYSTFPITAVHWPKGH